MAYCVYFAIRRCSPNESQSSGFHSSPRLLSLFVEIFPLRGLSWSNFETIGTIPATLLGITEYSSVSGVLTSPLFELINPRHVWDREAPSGVMALRPVTTTRRIGCSSYSSVKRVACYAQECSEGSDFRKRRRFRQGCDVRLGARLRGS
jgi:hypothetical protein